jgi:hypothetical protein
MKRLVIIAAALAAGCWLGYTIAVGMSGSKYGQLTAIVGIGAAALFIVVSAFTALVLVLVPNRAGRPMARVVAVAATLFVAGVGAGKIATPLIWPEFHEPVILGSSGTMTVDLAGIEGFDTNGEVAAACRSDVDSDVVAFVDSNGLGTVGTGELGATVSTFTGMDTPELILWTVPPVGDGSLQPMWQGTGDVVERGDGWSSGQIVFTELELTAYDEQGQQPEGWPKTLSGSLSWACRDWAR